MKTPTELRITVSRDELQVHSGEFLSKHIGHRKQQSEMISEDREKHTRRLSQVEFTCYDCADSIRIDITEEARVTPAELGNRAIVDQHESPCMTNDPVTRLEKDGDKLYRVTYAEQMREEVTDFGEFTSELARFFESELMRRGQRLAYEKVASNFGVNLMETTVKTARWLFEHGYLSDKIVKGGV